MKHILTAVVTAPFRVGPRK